VRSTPAELSGHNHLRFGYGRAIEHWPFRVAGGHFEVGRDGAVQASDGSALG
jgi:hypothetical protein